MVRAGIAFRGPRGELVTQTWCSGGLGRRVEMALRHNPAYREPHRETKTEGRKRRWEGDSGCRVESLGDVDLGSGDRRRRFKDGNYGSVRPCR